MTRLAVLTDKNLVPPHPKSDLEELSVIQELRIRAGDRYFWDFKSARMSISVLIYYEMCSVNLVCHLSQLSMQPFSSLPLSLILLIHLHILNYPRANEPQYDNHLFDGRLKGLKDRVKMMEDICYFLTSQLETSARNVRILANPYP